MTAAALLPSEVTWELAVVDMAGTTVRDDGLVERAIAAAVGAVHPRIRVDERDLAGQRGKNKLELFRALVGPEAEEALRVFDEFMLCEVRRGAVRAIPGATAALAELADRGVFVCLATGLSGPVAGAIIDRLGWGDVVQRAFSPQVGTRGRPYPDLVLRAALAARVTAMHRVCVCGDTVNDLASGRGAGAGLVVGVLTGAHSRDRLQAVPHAVVIDSIAALPGLLETTTPRPDGATHHAQR
jgi:phosphoglycolate phosphatase